MRLHVACNNVTRTCCLLALSLLLLTSQGRAQGTTATVSGVVKDQSGAVLPGATITVTHLDTGLARTAVTGTKGEFRVINLPPGAYQVQAELSGFQTEVRK